MTFNPSLKNALLFFAIGFLFGLFISFLWSQMLIADYKTTVQVESPKELVKQVAVTEKAYTQKTDSLNVKTVRLQIELTTTKAALAKASERTADLQKQTLALLDERFAIKQQAQTDTICDSLANVVPVLITSSQEKDSLYNSALSNLESQVQYRDSTIALKDLRYVELKSAFTKSIDTQSILANENRTLTKSINRQRAKSKVVTAALFILSGATAAYLLRH